MMNIGCIIDWQAWGTWAAVVVALFLGVWPIFDGRRKDKARAFVLRHQLYNQLQLIQPHLADRHTPLPPQAMRAIDKLEALWLQAQVLEPDEFRYLGESVGVLLPLREGWGMTSDHAFPVYEVVFKTSKLLATRLSFDPPDEMLCSANQEDASPKD